MKQVLTKALAYTILSVWAMPGLFTLAWLLYHEWAKVLILLASIGFLVASVWAINYLEISS